MGTNRDPRGTSIATWSFWGPSRVAELALGNGLICTHLNNTRTNSAVQSPGVPNPDWGDRSSDRLGYDGAGRMITKRYFDATASSSGYTNTSAVVGFTTAFDLSSNKLYERPLHARRRSHLYTWHDSLNRLRGYERGTLASGGGSVTPGQEINVPNTDEQRSYDLDGLGNWRRTVFTPEGAAQATTQARQHNYVNQLTQMNGTAVTYDHGENTDGRAGNGNVAADGTRKYEWDALNRLTRVWKTNGTDVPIAAYRYDGLGRRIRRTVTNGGLLGPSCRPGGAFRMSEGQKLRWIRMRGTRSPERQQTRALADYRLQELAYGDRALERTAGAP